MSGRCLVLFFAQTGAASWLGVALASALFSALVGLFARAARRAGTPGLAVALGRAAGRPWTALLRAGHAVLLGLVMLVMLQSAGRMGALMLPVRHAFLWGAVSALMLALLFNLVGAGTLAALGVPLGFGALVYYGAMALDARSVTIRLGGETALLLSGSLGWSALLAALYGCMNASVCAGTAARLGYRGARAMPMALMAGVMLCATLMCANAALQRGGPVLMAQAMPEVLLTARWGKAGYWLCAGFEYLCAVGTLTGAVGSLVCQAAEGARR